MFFFNIYYWLAMTEKKIGEKDHANKTTQHNNIILHFFILLNDSRFRKMP